MCGNKKQEINPPTDLFDFSSGIMSDEHIVTGFSPQHSVASKPRVYVKCKDKLQGRIYSTDFQVYVDQTAPSINFVSNPNPIIYRSQSLSLGGFYPQSDFVVTANEPVIYNLLRIFCSKKIRTT